MDSFERLRAKASKQALQKFGLIDKGGRGPSIERDMVMVPMSEEEANEFARRANDSTYLSDTREWRFFPSLMRL